MAQKMNAINIGFVGALNMPNANSQVAGHPAGMGFLAAVNEINSRSDILANHTLVPFWNSTDSELGKSLQSALFLAQQCGIKAVIGEYNSDYTQQVNLVMRLYNIPQIAYSTSLIFDNKVIYPTFFRGMANVQSQSISLARVCKELNWMRVGIIGSNSAFDVSTAQTFSAEALVQGITVLTSQVFVTGSCVDMTYQMSQLVASKARIIGLFAVIGDARCVVQWAWRYGLIGPGYFYFTTWSQMFPALYSNATNYVLPDTPATATVPQIPAFYKLFQNLLGLVPRVDKTRAAYRNVVSLVQNASFNPSFWTAYQQPPNIVALLAYDATYAMAYAWDAALRAGVDFFTNPGAAMPYLRQLNFTAVTGSYYFDKSQNRVSYYDILQVQGSRFPVIGSTDSTQKITLDKSLITFFGTSFPVDRPPLVYVSVGSNLLHVSIAIAVVGCSICIGVFVALRLNMNEIVVKSSSLLFNQIVLFGCFLIFLCIPIQTIDTGNTNATISASSCIAYTFLLSTGFCLVFLSLAAKTWRVVQIFGNELIVLVSIPDAVLLQGVTVFTLIDLIINIVWAATNPLTHTLTEIDELSQCERCLSTNFTPFLWASLGYKVVILVATCVLCFMARNVPAQFNEGALIFFAAYQSVLILVIALPMSLLIAGVAFIQSVRIAALAICALGMVLILYMPVLYSLFFETSTSNLKRSGTTKTPDPNESHLKQCSINSKMQPMSPKSVTYDSVLSRESSRSPRLPPVTRPLTLPAGTRVRVGVSVGVNRESRIELDELDQPPAGAVPDGAGGGSAAPSPTTTGVVSETNSVLA